MVGEEKKRKKKKGHSGEQPVMSATEPVK